MKPAVVDAYLRTRGLRRGLKGLGRRLLRRKRTVHFYYCVTDPYSHLMVQALRATEWGNTELEICVVPEPSADTNPAPALQARWAREDARRLARHFDLSLPEADGLVSDERVRRANAVLLKSREALEQLEALERVGRALHAGDPHGLSAAVERYGVVKGHTVRPTLEQNYETLRKRGHYQSGVCHYEGEWYVGLDRFDYLLERLKGEGVDVHSPSYRVAETATPSADELFFSFRSPYSYLALERTRTWSRVPKLRPVLPMVARGLEVPKTKIRYLLWDAKREAERLGIELGKVADPVGEGVERAMAVFFAAQKHQRGAEFARAAMRASWAEGRDLARDDVLFALAAEVGFGRDETMAALKDTSWKAIAEENRKALVDAGLWGVPTFVRGGEALWGQDRIPWLADD
ncbi:MAG: 2-hydroxychromene-2-carboxylate isomerase [Polyangiales bacterium]